MIHPRKMKHIELTVLKSDINAVLEYLGRHEVMHFTGTEAGKESDDVAAIRELLDRLKNCAGFLNLALPADPAGDSAIPGADDHAIAKKLCDSAELLGKEIQALLQEKHQLEETIHEAQAFSNMNAPFGDLDNLSYLTLRLGRLDPANQAKVRENLGARAVVIPLGTDGQRVLAASSRKGRFALDTELKNYSFEPIAIPAGYKGIPPEMLESLQNKLQRNFWNLEEKNREKEEMSAAYEADFKRLTSDFLIGLSIERLKSHLSSTETIFFMSGWVARDLLSGIVADLLKLSDGRVAIRAYDPEEIVREGGMRKVPVSLKHGAFVKGFEAMVFSYGAPLYGAIDPTPLVAIFFTLLFGIMFGDVGQGFVLFLMGILTLKFGPKSILGFRNFSVPLISAGSASMVMGLLTGSVFSNEQLLVGPTRALTGLFGHSVDRILALMPLASQGGSIRKLFIFFGFTIGIGVILNTIGLVFNIINRISMKDYEAAFLAKTGIPGFVFFWYALFIALRIISGGSFRWFDLIGLITPVVVIFFGPLIWRVCTGERPLIKDGFLVFFMEGFVEALETASSYFANTVSFLRVGAFALSHAVLSYIIFTFTESIVRWNSGPAGIFPAFFLAVFGNLVIIILEGMIVAIQVVRLQYYEFFSKFFTETGVVFSPFRFGKKV